MRLKQKISQLEEALHGFMDEHQGLMLKLMLSHIDSLDSQINTLGLEIERRLLQIQDRHIE
jgi:transposase